MNEHPTALVVVAHHRRDSLTVHIAGQVTARLEEAGYAVDVLDLHAEGFDPLMTVADQPDWDDRDKVYSDLARSHQRRILAADAIIPVFPIYWFSVPAILKGWIDRVWGYGFAYGRSRPRLAGKKMLWLGLGGAATNDESVPLMQEAMDTTLRDGISRYCGIDEAAVEMLLDAEAQPQTIDEHGNLVVGESLAGGARQAHYAELDRRAREYVAKFLGLD
ncbi:NAD(P)H oxidoreductase [Glycomyces albus]